MKEFINNCLSDGGKVSSKRVVTITAFILMSIGFISNLFWDLKIDEFIYESMQWIVMVGLGVTASEKFTKIYNNKSLLKD
jgi:hypothetical protein